ncbi:fused MFS/spermidine synthase [Candidatus Falkowbacteria bacterium]|nr:fused MFS/spermidine synthase [Candidatus Falkowbacteria bacterium]
MVNKEYYKKYLLFLAFVSGMAIMAVEISASRLLAPYFGTSTFVWTNIIGVIMAALAIGYYIGGKMADRKPHLEVILKIIIIACLILFSISFITRPLVEYITGNMMLWHSASLMIFFGSLFTVAILFIFPIILLGAVSPFIIKLLSQESTAIGHNAGMVFSISTVGSILGTFLPTLVFVPYLGTRKTIIFFSLLLFCTAIFGLLKRKWLIICYACLFFLLIPKFPAIKAQDGAIFEDESVYQYFQVADENNLRLLKVNEGLGTFSIINIKPGQIMTGSYFDYYNILPYLNGNEKKQDVLILGLAGGTTSTQYNYFFGKDYDLHIDGVEIDDKVISTAEKYFNLNNSSLTVYNFDGRNFLDYLDKKYNSIIIDVYSNQLYISFHLTTHEFFDSVNKHLKPKGIVAMNVNAVSPDSPILKNITNTMLLSFKNVYIIPIKNGAWNFMVLASENEIEFTDLNKIENIELYPIFTDTINAVEKVSYDNNFGYLTDDKAPIEHLTDKMIMDFIFNSM